jgi:chromosome segregation ATPase
MSLRRPPRPLRSPRTARSPEVAARLERSRARSKQRRELARQRERAIHEAVKRYLADWAAITASETSRDHDIAALREQISDLEARAASEIARYRADQAETAVVIRDHGASEQDIADLLEISVKQVRQLITAARAQHPTSPQQPSSRTAPIPPPCRPAHGRRRSPAPPHHPPRHVPWTSVTEGHELDMRLGQ